MKIGLLLEDIKFYLPKIHLETNEKLDRPSKFEAECCRKSAEKVKGWGETKRDKEKGLAIITGIWRTAKKRRPEEAGGPSLEVYNVDSTFLKHKL